MPRRTRYYNECFNDQGAQCLRRDIQRIVLGDKSTGMYSTMVK